MSRRDGVDGRGVPEPKVGVGAPREFGENRREGLQGPSV